MPSEKPHKAAKEKDTDAAKAKAEKAKAIADAKTAVTKATKALKDNKDDKKKGELEANLAEAKAELLVLCPLDPTRYVYNIAANKGFKPPVTTKTIVIVNDVQAAADEVVYSEKSDPKDPVKANWDKRVAAAKKKDADSETFTFIARHSPAPAGLFEVQCCETVDEAKTLILSLFPECTLDQIVEKKDEEPDVKKAEAKSRD